MSISVAGPCQPAFLPSVSCRFPWDHEIAGHLIVSGEAQGDHSCPPFGTDGSMCSQYERDPFTPRRPRPVPPWGLKRERNGWMPNSNSLSAFGGFLDADLGPDKSITSSSPLRR